MCQIDWTAIAAWIGALSTAGLLFTALLGFHIWKDQFRKRRDHDLALTVLRKMDDSTRELDALRSPHGIITDADVPIAKSAYEDEQRDWDYRKMLARYRARQQHFLTTANERADAVHEAKFIWEDCGQQLKALADELSEKEQQVLSEAHKYIENLHPNTAEERIINRDILFARAVRELNDPFANDLFALEYIDVVEQINVLLRPKIRLE